MKELRDPALDLEIDFSKINRLLEVGCGNGKLWKNNKYYRRYKSR